MAKVGRKTKIQKKAEEGKLQKRKAIEQAAKHLVDCYKIRKAKIEKKGSISDPWYEIFEETRSKSKIIISLYYPGSTTRAIKFSTYKEDKNNSLDMDAWSEDAWAPFIEDIKKYYAFIRRNK
jgi:hypothetical protein